MSIVPRDFFTDQNLPLSDSFSQGLWDRFFSSDVWNNLPFSRDFFPFPFSSSSASRSVPCSELAVETVGSVNVRFECKEFPEAHIFVGDLPGAKKDEVKVEIQDGGVIQISGGGSEGGSGRFKWRFRLPENAKLHLVSSSMENGVLTVVVPKVEAWAPPRRNVRSIEISGSG